MGVDGIKIIKSKREKDFAFDFCLMILKCVMERAWEI